MDLLKKYLPLCFFIISFVWALRVLLLPNYPDFQVHYYGAQHLVQRENPYLSDSNYYTPQVYPPFDMVFFIPLSFLPYEIAAKVWIILSITSVLLCIYLISKVYKQRLFSSTILIFAALVFLAFPTKFTFGMGQINAVILLFVTIVWYFLNKKDGLRTGIYLAFPVMLKFFPLLLLPYFFFLKKWKILISFSCALLVVFGLSLLFVSSANQTFFFQTLLPDLLSSWKGDYYNQSFVGVLMRTVGDESIRSTIRSIIPIITISFISFIFLQSKKRNQTRINLELSLLIITSLLINNFSWQHHFILLTLPFFIIFNTLREKFPKKSLYILLAVSYMLIAVNLPNPNVAPALIQNHVFIGGVLLWLLNVHILLRMKK